MTAASAAMLWTLDRCSPTMYNYIMRHISARASAACFAGVHNSKRRLSMRHRALLNATYLRLHPGCGSYRASLHRWYRGLRPAPRALHMHREFEQAAGGNGVLATAAAACAVCAQAAPAIAEAIHLECQYCNAHVHHGTNEPSPHVEGAGAVAVCRGGRDHGN